jgi:alkylation response protein AidB-like acyl-CoA dehydrogenase
VATVLSAEKMTQAPTDFQAQQADFLKRVQEFCDKEVLPKTREWEEAREFDPAIWPKLGKMGMLKVLISKEWDGLGYSCVTYCDMIRIVAKADPALAMNLAAWNALSFAHLEKFGNDEQKKKYLPKIASGEWTLAWALTEPDAGSDARHVKTFATPNPDKPGWYKLNGQKMFITNGGNADLIIVIARVDEKNLTAFLVEKANAGYLFKERLHTVSVSASNTVAFDLKDADGWHTPCTFEEAISFLFRGRLGIGAMALGIAEKAFELAVDYSKHREQFGRRLCDMQSVQNMIADSAMELEAARLLVKHGAQMEDLGLPIAKEASYAKLFASETANRVTDRALQIHGGRGMWKEFLVEKLWRDAKLTEIGEGASEIQRLVIAKTILK